MRFYPTAEEVTNMRIETLAEPIRPLSATTKAN
jgi:hypothetical protein